jgi:hypothetical protein
MVSPASSSPLSSQPTSEDAPRVTTCRRKSTPLSPTGDPRRRGLDCCQLHPDLPRPTDTAIARVQLLTWRSSHAGRAKADREFARLIGRTLTCLSPPGRSSRLSRGGRTRRATAWRGSASARDDPRLAGEQRHSRSALQPGCRSLPHEPSAHGHPRVRCIYAQEPAGRLMAAKPLLRTPYQAATGASLVIAGRCVRQGVACSKACPARNSVASAKGLAAS